MTTVMPDCNRTPGLVTLLEGRRLPPEETLLLTAHLAICPKCRKVLHDKNLGAMVEAQTSRPKSPERERVFRSPEVYSGVLDRVFRAIAEENSYLDDQRSIAPALLAELASHSSSQQKLLIRNSSRYQTWAVAAELLLQARHKWTEDPHGSEFLAQLALEVADRLVVTGFRTCLLNDLRAEAWSYIGNCRRIQTDYLEAQRAFRKAELLLEAGSGDRLERARLLDLKASLAVDRGHLACADGLLTEAIEEYRLARDRHLEGRSLMIRARLLRQSGQVQQAIPVLHRATNLIDMGREPRLAFVSRNNLVAYLLEVGRAVEAQKLLPAVRALAQEHASRLERLRLLWTEGLLCKELGHSDLAIEALKQVREGFIAAEIGFDVAAVSMDLAALYLETGRGGEVRKLAAESIPLFTSRGVQRQAILAWSLFRDAAERDAVTLSLIEDVASRIRRARALLGGSADGP